MFQDLWIKHPDRVLEPRRYGSIDELISKLGSAVVKPALEMREELLARRARTMAIRSLDEFLLVPSIDRVGGHPSRERDPV